MEERAKNYLDHYFIKGEPIGDCTVEVVLEQAEHYEHYERDARFLRAVANGVPAGGKIRDYVTAEEAGDLYKKSGDRPMFSMQDDPRWAKLWRWLMKGIKNEAELAEATARAGELMDAQPGTPDGVELDGLARLIQEYEDSH